MRSSRCICVLFSRRSARLRPGARHRGSSQSRPYYVFRPPQEGRPSGWAASCSLETPIESPIRFGNTVPNGSFQEAALTA
jgi:hypothetical protein